MIEEKNRKMEEENIIRNKLCNIEIANLKNMKNVKDAKNIGKGLEEWAHMIRILKRNNN